MVKTTTDITDLIAFANEALETADAFGTVTREHGDVTVRLEAGSDRTEARDLILELRGLGIEDAGDSYKTLDSLIAGEPIRIDFVD